MLMTPLILAMALQAAPAEHSFTCTGDVHPAGTPGAYRGRVTLVVDTPRGPRPRPVALQLGAPSVPDRSSASIPIEHCSGAIAGPPVAGHIPLSRVNVRLTNGARFDRPEDVAVVTHAEGNPEG